jgi:hypothetical protein
MVTGSVGPREDRDASTAKDLPLQRQRYWPAAKSLRLPGRINTKASEQLVVQEAPWTSAQFSSPG